MIRLREEVLGIDAETQPEQAQDNGAPINEGEQLTVDIEALGDQDDGSARIEHGYVIIVPKAEQGERVTIEITNVCDTIVFADVVERHAEYKQHP
ncbi:MULTISPECIES: TRAM domain-containing protein [Halostella]|uniref:TRAM domain-containing protein n=1 Tax=Halostella TaxID=1843185 RepID=UPI001F03A81E|nr:MULTISPECIES: TRAM domain-containing protein [Halostella]